MASFTKKPGELLWFSLLGLGMLIGAGTALMVLTKGHAHMYNVSREIPWGILISTYVFFVVSSTGLCLVSSLGHVFGIEQFELIGRRAILLSIITLLTGFGTIAMEINHPIRMAIYVLLTPNFESPIWWMGTLYGVYLVLLIGEFFFLMKNHHKGAMTMGILGFIAAVTAHSNLGGVFGLLEARPYWHGSFLPLYFILSALVSGGALISIIVYYNYQFRKIPLPARYPQFLNTLAKLQALFLMILIFFIVWKIIPGLYGRPPEKYEATMAVLTGPMAFNFWVFEVLIGMIAPVLILLNKKCRTPFGVMVAGALCTVGIFFMRYDLVIAGQIVPMREGSDGVVNGLLSYTPSLAEYGIVLGAMATCMFLYTLAEKVFDLEMKDH
ncbi:NrfD/PsrC family molybdoenzyme membrane anchor subunit [Trichloromonas sp.]|uniref:NrfD/PsrC family molybdoenzyme membrane anchor subunit n=1 Tax=Trichloromonas sp. TaxID=3069249 RepID=UPI003D8145A5